MRPLEKQNPGGRTGAMARVTLQNHYLNDSRFFLKNQASWPLWWEVRHV
jgi:hypothetical protein